MNIAIYIPNHSEPTVYVGIHESDVIIKDSSIWIQNKGGSCSIYLNCPTTITSDGTEAELIRLRTFGE